mmetsp:Transcript_1770/g.2694  ORF Transcript_1770/g.2694 Transcript_1770/m.2694 type:complete len:123 (+) Transcript_1770:152-520(+)|eukprot:CAMPEP_0194225522 /NCGR_PEP_ID=MMETSP0156-20130528/39792_1 /TAXON_ID=33649 /ORGANISM="Thalassionema nitzschioides, Strain L26-B" /LENGTH=122 /DNA_ID=CAMNT_0038957497 /DNA_START=146 /DNA_END=514 /DNA_ORIENTATION=-
MLALLPYIQEPPVSPTSETHVATPSMLRLMGTKDYETLERLIQSGAYNDVIQDDSKMLNIITFAVNFQVPVDILHLICNLNPQALISGGDLPFRLARQQKLPARAIIVMEAARQDALVKSFQ